MSGKTHLGKQIKSLFSRRNGRLIKDISNNKKYFTSLIDNGEELHSQSEKNYNYLWNFTNLKDIATQLKKTKKYYTQYKYKSSSEEDINMISI